MAGSPFSPVLQRLLEARPKVPEAKPTAPAAAAPATAAPALPVTPGAAPTASQSLQQKYGPPATPATDVAPASGPQLLTEQPTGAPAPTPGKTSQEGAGAAQPTGGMTPEAQGAVRQPSATGDAVADAVKSGKVEQRAAPVMERGFIRNYNFDQMDSTESVLKLIDQVAITNRPDGKKVQSLTRTRELAKSISFEDLTGTTPSGARSAEETHAAVEIMLELGDRVTLLGQWMAQHPDEVAQTHQFALRQYAAQLTAVEQTLSAAANEAGRTLNVLRSVKTARGLANSAEAIQNAMADWGKDGGKRLAAIINAASAPPVGVTPAAAQLARTRAVVKAARMATLPTFRDMWIAAYRNSLYSWKTHLRNFNSAVTMSLVLEPIDKVATAGIGAIRRGVFRSTSPRSYTGEAMARYLSLIGQTRSLATSMHFAAEQDRLWSSLSTTVSKRRALGQGLKGEVYAPSVSAYNLRDLANTQRTDVGRVGRAVGRLAQRAPTGLLDGIGTVVHLNDNVLSLADDMIIATNYEAEMFALAYRQAKQEGVAAGDATWARMTEILDSPTDGQMADAMRSAQYISFTGKQQDDIIGDAVKAARALRVRAPIVGNLLLPFVNTPGNLMRWTIQHTPMSYALLASSRARLAKGGVEADRVLAEMATGSSYMAAATWLYFSGNITGSANTSAEVTEAARAANIPRNSFVVGHYAVSYKNAADPLGMLLNLTTNFQETVHHAPDMESYAAMAMTFGLASGATLVDQSMMMGMARIVEAMSQGDEVGLLNQMIRFGVDFTLYPLAGSAGGTLRQFTRDQSGKPIVSQKMWDAMPEAERGKYSVAEIPGGQTVPIYAVGITDDLDLLRQAIIEAQNTWPTLNPDVAYQVDRWGNPVPDFMSAAERYVVPVNVEEYQALPQRDQLMVKLGIFLRPPASKFDYQFKSESGAMIDTTINLAHFDYNGHDSITEPGWATVAYQEAIGKARREAVDRMIEKGFLNKPGAGVDSAMASEVMGAIYAADVAARNVFLNQAQIKKQLPINGDLVRDLATGKKKAIVHPAANMPEFGP